jgi:hypothetical protein
MLYVGSLAQGYDSIYYSFLLAAIMLKEIKEFYQFSLSQLKYFF